MNLDNGTNEVWGSTDSSVLSGAPAIAYYYWTAYSYWFFGTHKVVHMDEVDIIFDYDKTPWKWTTSHSKTNLLGYGGSLRPIQTTAIHEMGHGLQLNHVNYEYNIMGSDWTHIHANGTNAHAYLGEDAADGMVHLYGKRSPLREDVAVVHWKYDRASGAYSDHEKTQIFNSCGNPINSTTVDGESHYRVSPGQTVRVEFTYENNGATRQNPVSVGFYISSNSYISTSDSRIGGASLDLGRNDVYTTKHKVKIPETVKSGQNYWLGAIIDESGSIRERVEWNNATYIPIQIR
jgi:hypothetical protein